MTLLRNAKPQIVKYFDSLSARIHREIDLTHILNEKRHAWRLADDTYTPQFVQFLQKRAFLRVLHFPFQKPYKPTSRYAWRDASIYQAVQTLKLNAYFTHHTAMALNGLTERFPKNIYLNFEQESFPTGELTQGRIDNAFRAKPRVTNYTATVEEFQVHLVNGKYTNQLGVIQQPVNGENGQPLGTLRFAKLERTLIDIAVRPAYSGGVNDVADAYRRARDKVSVEYLIALLDKLDFTYPYHQAIGFYCELAGYPSKSLETLQDMPREFDFYLTHRMKSPKYIKHWRLYVPADLCENLNQVKHSDRSRSKPSPAQET